MELLMRAGSLIGVRQERWLTRRDQYSPQLVIDISDAGDTTDNIPLVLLLIYDNISPSLNSLKIGFKQQDDLLTWERENLSQKDMEYVFFCETLYSMMLKLENPLLSATVKCIVQSTTIVISGNRLQIYIAFRKQRCYFHYGQGRNATGSISP